MAVRRELVFDKRRLSADGTATPFRHPRASRSGADQAHTLETKSTNKQTPPTHKGDFYNEQTHSKKPEFTHPANPQINIKILLQIHK